MFRHENITGLNMKKVHKRELSEILWKHIKKSCLKHENIMYVILKKSHWRVTLEFRCETHQKIKF